LIPGNQITFFTPSRRSNSASTSALLPSGIAVGIQDAAFRADGRAFAINFDPTTFHHKPCAEFT